MAKYTPGPLAGSVSGSIGGTTFSRNRYGPYMRRRAMVTTVTSPWAQAAKARMSMGSQYWQVLDLENQVAWTEWARTNPVVGSLGDAQQLTGHAAFVALGVRAQLMEETMLLVPPMAAAPPPLITCSLVVDTTGETALITFTDAPLGATRCLYVWACVVDSHGVNWVQNLLRQVSVSDPAQTTGYDIWDDLVERFGTISVDQVVHIQVSVVDNTSFLLSRPLRAGAIAGPPAGP